MSGYTREIRDIIDNEFRPATGKLISRVEEFDTTSRRSRKVPVIYDSDTEPDEDVDPEEARLLGLLGELDDQHVKRRILDSRHSDRIRSRCLQMLREYEDDPENNSTSLTALNLILRLPTASRPLPVTINNSYEEIAECLGEAWNKMDSNVYGQGRAKSEIIEYLVSKILTSGGTQRVLGLVGPPGVGKTSLAIHGIAKAIGLPLHQVSIGGLRDVTYFSGNMRCWKGAHHGKFADILVREECLNPIIYIDELDKVAVETAQDIYGLLTHVTDPMTNRYIHDHYLGIDIDLSQATFIFSYNDATALPAPLRDRIKEVHLDGFSQAQKVDIARTFIIPACLGEYGVSNTDVIFGDDIIAYANMSIQADPEHIGGVRQLQRGYQSLIGKVMVNTICSRQGYDTMRSRLGIGKPAGKKATTSKPKPKSTNRSRDCTGTSKLESLPYYRPVALPYNVSRGDIDYYLAG
jgi:ATP-dependent Lon protease